MNSQKVEEIVEIGQLDPNAVHLPGIYVDRLIKSPVLNKRIEVRTKFNFKKKKFSRQNSFNCREKCCEAPILHQQPNRKNLIRLESVLLVELLSNSKTECMVGYFSLVRSTLNSCELSQLNFLN
jgi:hypothetical protein